MKKEKKEKTYEKKLSSSSGYTAVPVAVECEPTS